MGLASLAHAIFLLHILETSQEDLFQNGLMSLKVGLNTARPRIEHTVFVVSCLETRRMLDMKHLLLLDGMVTIGKKG
jgi:hypothetical protein